MVKLYQVTATKETAFTNIKSGTVPVFKGKKYLIVQVGFLYYLDTNLGECLLTEENVNDTFTKFNLQEVDSKHHSKWADWAYNNVDTLNYLQYLGVISLQEDTTRNHNIGKSNYSNHIIQPWAIWIDHKLDSWRADIIKRVLRSKSPEDEVLDLQKIKHDCDELLRQHDTIKMVTNKKDSK